MSDRQLEREQMRLIRNGGESESDGEDDVE